MFVQAAAECKRKAWRRVALGSGGRPDRPSSRPRIASLTCVALLVSALAAGCGGGDEPAQPASDGAGAGLEAIPQGGADPEDVAVIAEWSETLRSGEVAAAARLFALPSTVQNGTSPLELETRGDVRAFNLSLPCGAELVRTAAEGTGEEELIVATFELTERPGAGSCGSGTGERARTAFVIRDGLIESWLRISAGGSGPARTVPSNPA